MRFERPIRITSMWCMLLGCLTAALAFGGIHSETIYVVAVLSVLGLGGTVWRSTPLCIDLFGGLLLGLALATILQCIPLPIGWLDWLAPATASTYRSYAVALGQAAPTHAPISLDVESTRLTTVWFLAIAATYLTVRQISVRKDQRVLLVLCIPIIGVIVVLIGLVHAVLMERALFGLYLPTAGTAPERTGALYSSTFVNANHLAAFLNLGMGVALGYGGDDQHPSHKRVLWVGTALFLAAGVALTGSKAGIITGGGIILALLFVGRAPAVRTGAVLTALVVTVLAVFSPLGTELSSLAGFGDLISESQRQTQRVGVEVLAQWPWTGVGRGAFGVAQTQVNGGISSFTVTHAHNMPIQLLADFGFFLGGLALFVGLLTLVPRFIRGFRDSLGAGITAALSAVFVHNLVDFSLDILGIAMTAALLVGTLPAPRRGIKLPWYAVTAVCLTTAALLTFQGFRSGPEAGPRRDAWIVNAPTEAIQHYPADAYAFLAAGVAKRSIPLLEHAQALHPTEAEVMLAQAALTPGTDALPLIQTALSQPGSWRMRRRAFALAMSRAKSAHTVLDALPDKGSVVASFLQSISSRQEDIIQRTARRFSHHPEVIEVIAVIRLRQNRLDEAKVLATRLLLLDESKGYRMLARVLQKQDRRFEAYHMFLEAGDTESILDAATAAISLGYPDRALSALDGAELHAGQLKRLHQLKAEARRQQREKEQPEP